MVATVGGQMTAPPHTAVTMGDKEKSIHFTCSADFLEEVEEYRWAHFSSPSTGHVTRRGNGFRYLTR
jgi:hypothetical protein